MDTNFQDAMSKRTDEELIKIVTLNRADYQPLAIIADEEEIKKRNIETTAFTELKVKIDKKDETEKQIDSKRVGSLIRFVHFIIDAIIVWILAFVLSGLDEFIALLLFIPMYLIYYYVMEAYFQKTVAKFITKTKVVTISGNKPSKNDILQRTFFRLMLSPIFFLFFRDGLQDTLSKTIVVKDDAIFENSDDVVSVEDNTNSLQNDYYKPIFRNSIKKENLTSFCSNCGSELSDQLTKFCPNCGDKLS